MTRCGRRGCACCQRVRRYGRTLAGTPVALAGAGDSIEASCTGKYKALVTNGIGGTLDRPCGAYCNSADVEAWRTAAEDMFARVRRAWNQTAPYHTIPKATVDYIAALENDYCTTGPDGLCVTSKLPESSWYNITTNLKASLEIARWMSRGACALELLDQARGQELPQELPPEPKSQLPIPDFGVSNSLPWILLGGLVVVLVLASGAGGSRRAAA